ncbi:hypothetical protein D3C72_2333550 [compost metagenome]
MLVAATVAAEGAVIKGIFVWIVLTIFPVLSPLQFAESNRRDFQVSTFTNVILPVY